MNVRDPLYGVFHVDAELTKLALTPEVRRLSQIRLLNTTSPSLAVLGDLRRFSHTLGVLHLANRSPCFSFSSREKRAFLAAVLLHDVSTPPFGHLVEYLLRERGDGSWNHENRILPTVKGASQPENIAHQIFGGRTLGYRQRLDELGFDLNMVDDIVGNRHALSKLLFGTLDLDNLDNVFRMCWALGLQIDRSCALRIASSLDVTRDGNLVLEQSRRPDVETWLRHRAAAYEIIVFDPLTVSLQAVLTTALLSALEAGSLTADDWDLYDEELLARLSRMPETRRIISLDYLGAPPGLLFSIQMPQPTEMSVPRLRGELCAIAAELKVQGRFYPYLFLDRGAFSKRVEMQSSTGPWSVGQNSHSLVIYGFSTSADRVPRRRRQDFIDLVLEHLDAGRNEARVRYSEGRRPNGSQAGFHFTS